MSWSSPTNTPSTALLPPARAKNNPQHFKRLLKFIRCHCAGFKKSYRVCFERAWLHGERVKKGRSGIVGVAALLHQKAAPFPWSSRLLYRGGGCARRAGREQPPTRSHRGPRAGLTDVPPPSRARGCHQGTGHRSCGHPHGSQAATQGRQRVSNRANPEMWRYCSAFIPAALGMDEVHWVRMHLGGCSRDVPECPGCCIGAPPCHL